MKNPTPKTQKSENASHVPQDKSMLLRRSRTHDARGTDGVHNTNKPGGLSRVLGESLRVVDLFANLDDGTRQAIGAVCRARRYGAGQPLVSQGDVDTDVFFVLEGAVRATLYSVNGREVAFEDLEEGALFGELSAIDARPRSTSVVALSDCVVAVMPRASFKAMLDAHPGIAWQILTRLTALVRTLCDRVFEYSTLDVRQRVQAEVLRLARAQVSTQIGTQDHDQGDVAGGPGVGASVVRDGDREVAPERILIERFPTHAELAARISTHREAVTREINALDRAGIISRESDGFVVRDLGALLSLVDAGRA